MNSTNNNIEVPHFKIVISENDNTGSILKTVRHVRPKWDTTRVKLKLLTDGITNKLVLCSVKSENGDEEYILVRIYGHKTDLLIDRRAEIRNIKQLHTCDLAPTLYATFENGLVYEFIPGNTLSADDVLRPEIYKLVAVEMAKMHKVRIPSQQKPVPSLWSKFQLFVDLIPESFEDIKTQKRFNELKFSKSELLQEIRQIKEAVNEFDMPVVFCHNDLLLGNIIYNKSKNKVSFIDFEYACFNYQPFDIANHFSEYAGVTNIDYSRFPKKDYQLDWLTTYLMEYKGVTEVDKHEIEVLYVQVNKFVLAAHLFWYSWALIQAAYSHIDFDFMEFAELRLKEYFVKKPLFLTLNLPKY